KDFVIEAATNKMKPACPRFPVTQGLSAKAMEERRTVMVPDVSKEPCFLPNFWSTKSEVIVPIIDDEHDRVLGVINVESAKVNDSFEIARFDDAGNYRPLKTAPTLRHGWKIFVRDLLQVEQVIDTIYPGRLAMLRAFKSGGLTTTSLRETLKRQSGMYRVAAKISDEQIDRL